MKFFGLLIYIFFLFVIYQDFKYRAISWFLFPLAIFIFVFIGLNTINFDELLFYFLINISFILLQIITLTIYFSLKTWKLTNIFKRLFGIGDLLFLITISILFSPVNFILSLLIGLFFVLIIFLIINKIVKNKRKIIPLAGALSIYYFLLFILNYYIFDINFYNDQSIINFILTLNG